VVKINFSGGKNQFFLSDTRKFPCGLRVQGNALIWLVGIRSKACLSGKLCAS